MRVLYTGPPLAGVRESLHRIGLAEGARVEEIYPQHRLELAHVLLQTDLRSPLYFEPPDDARAEVRAPFDRYVAFLRETDAIVFVADSQSDRRDANLDRLARLERELSNIERSPHEIPIVFQCNKRDRETAMGLDAMRELLRWPLSVHVPSIAATGEGVLDALRAALTFKRPASTAPYR